MKFKDKCNWVTREKSLVNSNLFIERIVEIGSSLVIK